MTGASNENVGKLFYTVHGFNTIVTYFNLIITGTW